MRKLLIVGNWKMHLNVSQASLLVHRLHDRVRLHRNIEVVLAPSMLDLQPISLQIDRRKFRLAAQNAYHQDEGAFTGEVSFTMLRDLVHYALVGHSERRIHFHEDLPMIRDKVKAAIRNDISPVLCVGETQHERKEGMTKQVLHDQVTTALSDLTAREVADVVIAYEPVWAIGAGDPAKPDQIEEAVQFIRHNVSQLYGEKIGKNIRVIYGASVEPEFVAGILSLEGVDGLLPGGASLNPYKFSEIIEAAHRMQAEAGEDA
jgi:triosephosphate isomerase (TIM)